MARVGTLRGELLEACAAVWGVACGHEPRRYAGGPQLGFGEAAFAATHAALSTQSAHADPRNVQAGYTTRIHCSKARHTTQRYSSHRSGSSP